MAKKRSKSKPRKPAARKSTPRATARRRAAQRAEREAIAESIRLSEAAAQRRRKRDELESQRESEREADRVARAKQVRQRASSPELRQLLKAYDRMAGVDGVAGVSVENAPTGEGILPWLVLGEFTIGSETSYAELSLILEHWERDIILETMIKPQRLAWIRIVYQRHDEDGDAVGKPEGYAASGAGPWEKVISEAVAATDPDDEQSLASRYVYTTIGLVQVYFGQL